MSWKIYVYDVQRTGRYNHILRKNTYNVSPNITVTSLLEIIGNAGITTILYKIFLQNKKLFLSTP